MSRNTKFHRLVYVACALFVGLLLGGYGLYRFREITGHLDRLLVRQLQTQLGREVRSGRVTVDRKGRFEIRDLRVAEGRSFKEGTFFRVDRVTGKLNLFSPGLWRSEPIRAMEQIDLYHPRVNLIRQKTGRWNFQSLLRPSKPGAKPVRFAGLAHVYNGELSLHDYTAKFPAKLLPASDSLTLVNGTVDGRGAAGLALQVSALGDRRIGPLSLAGTYDPLGKAGTVSARVNGADVAYWVDYFTPPNRTATLRSGRADVTADLRIVDNKVDLGTVRGTALISGGVLALAPLKSPLRSIRVTVRANGSAMQTSGTAYLENIPLTLSGRVPDLRKPVLDARAAVGTFDVGRLPLLVTALRPGQWPGLTGPVTVSARLTGPPNDLRVTADVRSPRLVHPRAVAQGVVARALYAKGKLRASAEVRQAFGGALTVEGTYQVLGNAHPWTATGRFSGLDLKGVAPPTAPNLDGRASGTFRFAGNGKTLSGRSELAMAEGSVGPFRFWKGAGTVTTANGRAWDAHLTLARGSVQRFDFRSLVADARYDHGVVTLSSARADAWQGRLKASGRVTTAGALDLNLNADRVRLTELLAPLNQKGYTGVATFDGRLTGTGKAPVLTGHLVSRDGEIRGIPYSTLEGRLRATPALIGLQDGTLRSGRGLFAVNGDVAVRKGGLGAVNLSARFQNVPGSLLSRLDLGPGSGLTLTPALRASTLNGSVRATGLLPDLSMAFGKTTLTLPHGSVGLTGNVALRRGRPQFDRLAVDLNQVPLDAVTGLQWNGKRLLSAAPASNELRGAVVSGGLDLTGNPSAMRVAVNNARLTLPQGSASVAGTLALGKGMGASRFTARLDRVPASLVDGLQLPGMQKPFALPQMGRNTLVSGVGTVSGSPGNWRGSGNLTAGPVVVQGFQGAPMTIQEARTRFTLRGDRLTLEDTTLLAEGQTLTGGGQIILGGGPVDFRLTGNQIPLEALQAYVWPLASISGRGDATVTAQGRPGTDLNLRMHVDAGPIIVNGVRFDTLTGGINWDGRRLQMEDLRLRRGNSLVYVPSGRYNFKEKYLALNLQASSVDIESLFTVLDNAPVMRMTAGQTAVRLLSQFPAPRGGIVNGTVSLDGPLSNMTAKADLRGDAVLLGQTTFDRVALDATWSPTALQVAQLSLDSPGIHLTGSGALAGRTMQEASGKPVELTARLTDTQVQQVIRLVNGIPAIRRSALGERILRVASVPRTPVTGNLDARLVVFGPMEAPQGTLDFDADHLQIGAQPFEVAKGSFAIDGRRFRVQNLRIEGGEAVVTARGTRTAAGAIDFDLNVNNLNLQLLAPWVGLPRNVRGTVDVVRVLVSGTQDDPVLQASLNASGVGSGGFTADFIEAPDIHAENGILDIGEILVRKRVPEMEDTEFKTVLTGSLPFTVSPLGVPKNGPLDLHARFNEQDLGLLAVFTPEVKEAAGTVVGSLDVTGTASKPVANGAFTLKDGSVQLVSFQNRFIGLNGQLTFSDNKMVLNEFRGASSSGGEFVLAGSASLERFPQSPIAFQLRTGQPLHLEGSNVSKFFGERFDGRLEADVNATGTLARPVLQGFLLARQTTLTLPDKPVAETVQPAKIFFPNPTFRNFRVTAGEGFLIRRGTFQGEVNGDLILDGAYPIPGAGRRQAPPLTATGTFDIDRGRVRVGSRSFRIQDGSTVAVNYRAPDPPRIRLDIEATTSLSSYSGLDNQRETFQITVNLTGPLDNPNLNFTSDPPGLSRQQILASLGYQSQIQAIFHGGQEGDRALRQGLAEAFTGVVTPSLLDPLEFALMRALNLEEFTVNYDFQSPLQVQITKHLWSKFYFTYRRQLTGTGQDYMFKLYYRLTPRINISYSTDERGGNTYLVEGRLNF